MIPVSERIGIIGGSVIYNINLKGIALTSRIWPNVVSRLASLISAAKIKAAP